MPNTWVKLCGTTRPQTFATPCEPTMPLNLVKLCGIIRLRRTTKSHNLVKLCDATRRKKTWPYCVGQQRNRPRLHHVVAFPRLLKMLGEC